MFKIVWLFAVIIIIAIGYLMIKSEPEMEDVNIKEENINMKLISNVFEDNQTIPVKYTCDGENINPPLQINEVPLEAKSLVLIMDDPDAVKPAGKVWDHWLIWNIPPTTSVIAEGKEPLGIHGIGTAGNMNYHGPCPPDAAHRYFFKLYALDVELSLLTGATKRQVEEAMVAHVLDSVELVGRYERK